MPNENEITPDVPQLDERQARKLIARINAGIEDVANLIIQLYYGKGWSAMGYTSWASCCKGEFNRSASWACRQIKAAEQRKALALPMATDDAADTSEIPESHLRELRKAGGPTEQAAAWQEVRDRYGDDATAAQVAEVVAERNTIDVDVDDVATGPAGSQPTTGERGPEVLATGPVIDGEQAGRHGAPCPNCGCTEEDEYGDCIKCRDPKTPEEPDGEPARSNPREPAKLHELRELLDECCRLFGEEAVQTFLTDWFDDQQERTAA